MPGSGPVPGVRSGRAGCRAVPVAVPPGPVTRTGWLDEALALAGAQPQARCLRCSADKLACHAEHASAVVDREVVEDVDAWLAGHGASGVMDDLQLPGGHRQRRLVGLVSGPDRVVTARCAR